MGGNTQHKAPTSGGYPKLAERPVGQHIHNIYRDRLRQFASTGQYQSQNLVSMLDEGCERGADYVKLSVYSVPHLARPSFKSATSNTFKATHIGESFGPSWSTHWFKIELRVPDSLKGKEHLEFHWDAGSEGLIWTEAGEPLQGLSGGERSEWIFPREWRDGKRHCFYIEMACNSMFGNAPGGDTIQPPNPGKYFTLQKADIVAVNVNARALLYDFWIIGDAARELPQDSWEEHKALEVANAIMNAFVHGRKESLEECLKIASEYLGDKRNSSEVYANEKSPLVYAVGHCHIDSCWLWPWAETKRKIARSWANQCELMDRYPEHRFVCSQAQQYKWLEQHYPSLYDRVKAKVKVGTFQPIGGSWVEHDTNMPSGESLTRQFVYGQRFFESHFGERCTTFWLPDTFGYAAQLPQLCRLAGMSRFFTQKLSWNNIDKFPHTTFNWVALDGSQVICHMPPSETYTAEAHFGDVKRSISQHKSLDQDNTALLVFGKGDGGGGPTSEHLEKLRRCRGMSDKIGMLPRVKLGDSVDDFFAKLEKKAREGTEYVTWYGELYFELHRGTYTTQANNKRNNRHSELLMHDIEYLATFASIMDAIDGRKHPYSYPKKDIDDLWEKILLCQFHDCLPGTSIEMCYDDSDELYAEVFERGQVLLRDALNTLGFSEASKEDETKLVAINTFSWVRAEIGKDSQPAGSTSNNNCAIMRSDGGIGQVNGFSALAPRPRASIKQVKSGVFELTNDDFKVLVENGVITSLYDLKARREIVPKGSKANQFVLFDDKPLYWQAWDAEVYHLESRKELETIKSEISESGPDRVAVVVRVKVSEQSHVKTVISLAASLRDFPSFVEIECEVEWREKMKFLKVEFPVDVRNTEASYDAAYGIVKRPTHYNTSWDMAKFEVCCHKWADLSEHGYGVSILNESKYGFATVGNIMRLSLLRAPKAPDANADMGKHSFRYAILPHEGPLDARTIRTAYSFNNPMRVYSYTSPSERTNTLLSSVRLSGDPSLILDAVKRGEDDEDVSRGELPKRKGRSVILRIYDSLGGRSRGTIESSLPVEKVWKCNLLEDDEEVLDSSSKSGTLSAPIELRPFEVATYRLQL